MIPRCSRPLATIVLVALTAHGGGAAEFFVNRRGNDDADGGSRATAFATIQRGVDALQAGDTLTIDPGEYHEAVTRADLGSLDEDTVIRAAVPRTVLLRGDVEAPAFRKLDGFRFVYVADFDREATAVNELDTLSILESVPNLHEVEFSPGTFHQDLEAGKLYISASDLQPATEHAYTVCLLKGRGGMHLLRPRRVVLQGLAATGFNTTVRLPRLPRGNSASDCIPWGLFLSNPTRCRIEDCVAYLNAGGIAIQSGAEGGSNRVEDCTAYGNASTHSSEGGNITVFNTHHDIIRRCTAYVGKGNGIRFYNSSPDPAGQMEHGLAWGHLKADFHIKAGPLAEAHHCVALHSGSANNRHVYDSLGARPMGIEGDQNNIILSQVEDLDMDREFADPVNLDFRLQATSRFRGAGPDGKDRGPYPYEASIFYVGPDGDDDADGLSAGSAWRTLSRAITGRKAGDTLYLASGVYEEDIDARLAGAGQAPIAIRGRGVGPAVIRGTFRLTDSAHVEIERLYFEGAVALQAPSADVKAPLTFRNCRFDHRQGNLTATDVNGLRVAHCEFRDIEATGLRLTACRNVDLRGNLYENANGVAVRTDAAEAIRYSGYNGYRRPDQARMHGDEVIPLAAAEAGGEQPMAANEYAARPLGATPCLATAGPLATSIGIYRARQRFDTDTLRVAGPFVHSVADTTANIEWWSSERAIFEAAWGETPACTNRSRLTPATAYHPGSPLRPFNTFSLTGLKPDTTYYFRLAGVWLHDEPATPAEVPDAYREPVRFTTAARPVQPRVYYVATEGDDTDTGLDRQHAWRTIHHAASRVQPGDRVVIGGGVYHEHVRVRVTGDAGRPITFTCAPGEKVTLDGAGKTLVAAFSIANKAQINLDGLYFQNHQRHNTLGLIRASRVDGLRITRCFQDGRSAGYDPEFLTAGDSRNLLVKNCVTISGWDGLAAGGSKHVRIENNVIVRPLIRAVCLSGGEDIQITGNIMTDGLAKKRGAALIAGSAFDARIANNCFFLRVPESERPLFGRSGVRLADYEDQAGLIGSNLITDPGFRFTRPEGHDPDREAYFTDVLVGGIHDFPDLFTTHPTLIERGIGLEPDAFSDFDFGDQ